MGTTHHSLPLPHRSTEVLFRSSKVEPAKIRVVIPVHNDWSGLKTTLDSLQKLNPRPGNITVVNDNTDNSVPEWLASYPVEIIDYEGNRGPAYARNKGCEHPDPKFDWFYFTDCGCRHSKNLIMHFIDARQKRDDSVIAICGSVTGRGSGVINRYMTEMNILNPPFENEPEAYGGKIPQAIITSNALVYAPAFHQLGGFSTDFCEAGGEDLDLGIRLRELGTLAYVPTAMVSHEFEEDIQDFKKRFERYGRGNRFLEQKHKLPSLRAQPFPIANVEFRELAKLQTESLRRGYDEAEKDMSRIDVSYLDNIDGSPNLESQIAKDVKSTEWHLPEGAKLRLGKGKINDVEYSPDGNQRAIASSIGVWIYDTHTGEELAFLTGHIGSVLAIAYSPDSLTLASGSEDKTIHFWDTHTGTHKFTLRKHKESITALAFSPDGSTLISGSADGTVHVWDAHTGDYKSTLLKYKDAEYGYPLSGHVTALAFSPDGSMFVTKSEGGTNEFGNRSKDGGTIHFWESETRFGQNQCLATRRGNFTALSFNSDGNMFATASGNGIIELRNGVSVQSIDENKVTLKQYSDEQKSEIHTLVFSPDSRILVGGSEAGPINVWDTNTQQHITTLKGHSTVVSSVGFSPDGATLISEDEDGTIRLWDTHIGQSETIFTEHLARIRSIKFSPDGQTLMSSHGYRSDDSDHRDQSSDNDTLHLWDVGTGIRKATFTAHSYCVDIAEFSPDSSTLAIWSKTGALELWDVGTCLPKITFAEKVEEVTSIIFSPDGRVLVSRNNNSTVIWDVKTGKRKVTLAEDGMGPVKSVHLSPDNRTIISISEDETNRYPSNERDVVQLWDVETGERKVISTEDGKQEVKPIFLSSDNRTLISVSRYKSTGERGYSKENGIIHFWDVETINRKISFTDEKLGNVKSVLLSSDNRTLISVSRDKSDRYRSSNEYDTIRLWDVETGTCKAILTEKPINVESAILSSDTCILAILDERNTIYVWNVETGKQKRTLKEDGIIESIQLGSDNLTLVSISTSKPSDYYSRSDEDSDNIIHLWDVETGTCKATFTKNIGKVTSVNLSPDGSTLILNQIDLWDVETGERKIDPIANITDIALSPDGNIIATGNEAGTILLWKISK